MIKGTKSSREPKNGQAKNLDAFTHFLGYVNACDTECGHGPRCFLLVGNAPGTEIIKALTWHLQLMDRVILIDPRRHRGVPRDDRWEERNVKFTAEMSADLEMELTGKYKVVFYEDVRSDWKFIQEHQDNVAADMALMSQVRWPEFRSYKFRPPFGAGLVNWPIWASHYEFYAPLARGPWSNECRLNVCSGPSYTWKNIVISSCDFELANLVINESRASDLPSVSFLKENGMKPESTSESLKRSAFSTAIHSTDFVFRERNDGGAQIYYLSQPISIFVSANPPPELYSSLIFTKQDKKVTDLRSIVVQGRGQVLASARQFNDFLSIQRLNLDFDDVIIMRR